MTMHSSSTDSVNALATGESSSLASFEPAIMSNTPFESPLAQALSELSLTLEPAQIGALLSYLDLLQRWNQVYNLTAVRDPQAMLVQHLFDSLAVVKPLEAVWWQLGGRASPYPARVMDVGTGAGLPGLVLALVWPQAEVHLVEPVGKKTAFLEKAVGALGLRGRVTVHQQRVEQVQLREAPELIVCRAFASLADFATSVEHLIRPTNQVPTTQVAAMKAQWPEDEIAELRARNPGWSVAGHARYQVPHLEAQRRLIWLEHASLAGRA